MEVLWSRIPVIGTLVEAALVLQKQMVADLVLRKRLEH